MPDRSAAVFVNEAAGSAGSRRVQRTVQLVRAALDAELHVTATRSPMEFEAWLRERAEGLATAIIAGGDGSLGVAYNVLAGRQMRIGHVPAGFGNATAHLLRLPRDPEALTAVITRGVARPVDLMAVDGRLSFFAGAGWDAVVARRYAAAPAPGLPGWVWAVSASVPELWSRRTVRVAADGEVVHEGPMELLVAGTTPFYGRGLLVNPGARPDAGRLLMRVYVGPAPRLALEALRWGTRRRPAARPVEASTIDLTALDGRPIPVQADGDVLDERTSWRFEIRPAAAHLIGAWA